MEERASSDEEEAPVENDCLYNELPESELSISDFRNAASGYKYDDKSNKVLERFNGKEVTGK